MRPIRLQAADSDENSEEEQDEKGSTLKDRLISKSYLSFSTITIDSSYWWKLEIILEIFFYIALIALIFSIIRFLSKSKSYRTVHITAPVLDDIEHKNIVKAAASLREKLGKKDYERLEEFI